jgi:hypothetical protein
MLAVLHTGVKEVRKMNKTLGVLALVAIAGLPLAAAADPYAAVQKAAAAFGAQKGIHAEERFSNGQTVLVDMVPPDRFHMFTPATKTGEIVIGHDMWMERDGKYTKLPAFAANMVGGTIDRYRQTFPQQIDKASVKDLGMQNVGGRMLHAYSYVASGAATTVWIDGNYLPQRMVTTSKGITTTVLYSYGNVSVNAP